MDKRDMSLTVLDDMLAIVEIESRPPGGAGTVLYNNSVNKYGTALRDLEIQRDTVAARPVKHLKRLGHG